MSDDLTRTRRRLGRRWEIIFSVATGLVLVFLTETWTRLNSAEEVITNTPNRSTQNRTRYLPACEKLMQSSKLNNYANGSFLTSKQTHIEWKLRPDDSRELTLPDVCHLKRYTAAQAGACLKNKNLLFIGDSLTRYQFMSLSYFLVHKHWPKRFHALQPCTHISEDGTPACNSKDEPSVCAERDWLTGWGEYYQNLGGGTDGGVFHGRMESQSVRFDTRPKVKGIMDNMRYTSSNEYGEENGRTQLTFIYELGKGNEPFRQFNFNGCGYNATCRYTPEQYDINTKRLVEKDFDWEYPNITLALDVSGNKFHAQNPDVDYLFYNRGLWGALPPEKAVQMMNSMSRMSNRCFYKTTTTTASQWKEGNKLASHEDGPVRKAANDAGCEFYDVGHVTEEFGQKMKGSGPVFWDNLHYVPWVYEELNNLLLNILCNNQVLN